MSMELSGNSLPLLDKFWTNKNKYKKFIPVKNLAFPEHCQNVTANKCTEKNFLCK